MQVLNWRIVLLSALPGAGFAVSTIFGWIQGFEHIVMLAMITGIGIVSGLVAPRRAGITALLGGFLAVLIAIWLQGVFLTTYFANNPAYLDIEIPMGLSARVWTFAFAPPAAILAGSISMIMAMVVRAVSRKAG